MKNKKNVLKIVLGILIGGGLLYWAFRDMDWEALERSLSRINKTLVFLGVLSMLASHFVRGARWKLLIEANGVKISTLSAFWAVMVGYMVNNAIPRGGEVARCTILKESDDIPVAISFGTVVVERVFDMLIMAGFLAIIFVTQSAEFAEGFSEEIPQGYIWGFLGGFFGVIFLGVYLVLKFQNQLLQIKWLAPVMRFVVSLSEAVTSITKIRQKSLFLLETALIWFFYILSTYLILLGLPNMPDRSFYFAMTILIIGGIGIVIPSPGGLGSYHSIVIYLFEMLGYGKQAGQLMAMISHSTIFIMNTIVGAVGYFILITKKKRN